MDRSFVYLASPYTDPDPLVRQMRYLAAASTLRTLLLNRVWTYSPIVHCHELSQIWGMPHDAAFWLEYDSLMIERAHSVAVLTLAGWERSSGVKGEILLATNLGKPVTYICSSGDPLVDSALKRNQDSRESPAS